MISALKFIAFPFCLSPTPAMEKYFTTAFYPQRHVTLGQIDVFAEKKICAAL